MKTKYERAEALMQGVLSKTFVHNATVIPHWIPDSDCFWYERTLAQGKQFRLVNAQLSSELRSSNKGGCSNEVAFNHSSLAEALAKVSGQKVNPENLPIHSLDVSLSPFTLRFMAFDREWLFDAEKAECRFIERKQHDGLLSPNGTLVASVREHNVWLQNLQTKTQCALTRDGEDKYPYAAVGSVWSWAIGEGMQARWSPDSKKLLTVQRDTRQVKTLPVVAHVPEDGGVRPVLSESTVAYPGDEHVECYRLLSLDVASGAVCAADYHHIPVCRDDGGFFNLQLGWWANDSQRAYFIDQTRGNKALRVVEFNTQTGATRVLFEELSATQIHLTLNAEDSPQHIIVPETNELIWYSERSGWAHLYLYDLDTGELKNTITSGEWLVRDVLHFDAARRQLFIQTASRMPARDPYYCDVCRVDIDTGDWVTLVSTDHDYVVQTLKSRMLQTLKGFGWDIGLHAAGVQPAGNFVVVTRSCADQLPTSLLLNREGDVVLELESGDESTLPEFWQWPEPIRLMAADGETPLYGLLHKPANYSPHKQYPVINYMLNSPDLPAVSKGSFVNARNYAGFCYLDAAALAELGFFVVLIDSRGTSCRNKAFLDESYGWTPSSCQMEDHIAGIQQMAEQYPAMDLERVGIISPGGQTGALQSLLTYPDFYKVGVIHHLQDSRLMPGPVWGEKYEGLQPQSNNRYPEALVANFKAKLLLTHGMLDSCNPPASTFRIVEALQLANKDFDMVLLPNLSHTMSSYLIRRTWDYFVMHLLGENPPQGFKLTTVFG